MPLQNRVDPAGNLIVNPARGTLMGNRGGAIHDEGQRIVRPYKSRQWIACLLSFKGRRRAVMTPRLYTELFFLDEATAFAAGHRPCAECRRADFRRFLDAWPHAEPGRKLLVQDIDRVLHDERVARGGGKVTYEDELGGLPDGTFVVWQGAPHLVWGGLLVAWSPAGYRWRTPRPDGRRVTVLTPRSFVETFRAGYRPAVHATAL